MQFAFTDEQAMIAETAAAFFSEQATSERTRLAMDKAGGHDAALWSAFTQELGLAGVALPETFGGVGLGLVELAILAEAAGRHVAAFPFFASIALAATAIARGGTEAQQQSWLPRLATGESIATLALSDASGKPDAFGARIENGKLSGSVHYVPHGAIADLFVVAAKADDGSTKLALVEKGAAGLSVTGLVTMDQTRPYARLDLDGVDGDWLEDGDAALQAALLTGWVALAADALGGAQSILDQTVEYSKERVQFGRVIGSFQAVKHRLADMMVEIEQARSAVYWAACAADENAADAALAAHAAKAFATDAYGFCAGSAIQLLGGIGFTWEHDAHLYFKRARSDASLLGSPDWHREAIAQAIGLDEVAA